MELLLQNGADINAQVRQPIKVLPSPGPRPGMLSLEGLG